MTSRRDEYDIDEKRMPAAWMTSRCDKYDVDEYGSECDTWVRKYRGGGKDVCQVRFDFFIHSGILLGSLCQGVFVSVVSKGGE